MGQLTSAQLSEWEAYDKIDPIGSWRDDYRIAVLDSLIVNIVSKLYPKKGHPHKDVSPMDFMPNWNAGKEEPQKQSVEEMKRILMGIASSANKKLEQDKKIAERAKIPPRTNNTRRPPVKT